MNSALLFQLFKVESISNDSRKRMFELMSENYNKVTEANFFNDLDKKQWVGLINDVDGIIQGFTTFAIDPGTTAEDDYHVLFSGDTVLATEHWGTQVMMQGWCTSVGRFIAGDNKKPWYWYLLSKGHRTYMYLPLFFEHYYPAIEPGTQNDELKKIADRVSRNLFPDSWKPDEGILRFDESLGELKPELAEATFQKKGSPFINFFLEKNPAFNKGEELVCTALIHPDHLLRSAKKFILEGMKDPILH